ncbi:abortive infection family protein [Serratia surfactantfaciens]|uniref:abortive infection family protein n=1 Tax=Serratia surfactantfaciens TaxID=2741499 RepID=UPI0009020846|nr:abortive infection family protein [Serratia surfactantfaciens]MBI6150460.1 abortive infection family protein [Serratia surfactantfaciens]
MSQKIPNSVIGAVASVIAEHYYSHSKLNTLFMESGAPGDPPDGNCETKCSNWLKHCNDDTLVNALEVLGALLQEYMDQEPPTSLFGGPLPSKITEGQTRIINALAKNQLVYRTNGYIVQAGSTAISKTLEDYLKSGDFFSIEKEFERAVEHINGDPQASITAACAIIEATLKFYIERFSLVMPNKLNVMNLWATVHPQLSLNSDVTLAADQQKVLKGLSSIIDGVGAFRSHIGSAHGRGSNPPNIVVAEARLVINAAHTIVVFVMELMHAKTN